MTAWPISLSSWSVGTSGHWNCCASPMGITAKFRKAAVLITAVLVLVMTVLAAGSESVILRPTGWSPGTAVTSFDTDGRSEFITDKGLMDNSVNGETGEIVHIGKRYPCLVKTVGPGFRPGMYFCRPKSAISSPWASMPGSRICSTTTMGGANNRKEGIRCGNFHFYADR